ncbi:hypothetical protein Ahy_A01g004551 [Arachis hypogaea]|uniref:AAA+ ATPase domain-containing protein n=1 Tax=Arachis hypogaea TaxID=3818 RepID=A0A445EWE8_ARAHY|nr:hypothetical protein Ahy_A01g004551 [Arachis hypogaea]
MDEGSPKNNIEMASSVVAQHKDLNQRINLDKNSKTPILDIYGTDVTKLAREGKLHPFVGRKEQLERVIKIICRLTKNNPCLVGEPGVGKTAIIEGLAHRILSGSVPQKLRGKKVIKLDVANFLYVIQSQGDFENIIKRIIKEVGQSGDVLLFVKEVQNIFETSSSAQNFAYHLGHALERGVIQCIFATTMNEHRKHIENDATMNRLFQQIKVFEPSVEETIQILKGLRGIYESHHKLQYTDEALAAAANLSQQYISDRFLPDKAIDLIDEAGSHVQLCHAKEKNRQKVVTKYDIQHVVSCWSGVPLKEVSMEEGENLLNLEHTLHKYVVGQNEAINSVCRAIRRARVGLRNSKRPIASFIFTGPSGVGKTEIAKALAAHCFGSQDALLRFDMSKYFNFISFMYTCLLYSTLNLVSFTDLPTIKNIFKNKNSDIFCNIGEYIDRATASRLIGAPPGYIGFDEGGQLTEAVRNRSHAVVLFDEIEKAHSDVFNLLLQILEDGRLTDGKGQTVDFKSTLIIMTCNIGNNIIVESHKQLCDSTNNNNDDDDDSFEHRKSLVIEEVKQHFRPEFLNRVDEIIVFKTLTRFEVEQIANLMLGDVSQRLKGNKDIHLSVTCRFRDRVVEHGYDPIYGARPLRRTISRLLEDTLAEKMLMKEIREGDSVVVDTNIEGNVVVLNQNSALRECLTCIDHSNGNSNNNNNSVGDEKREKMVGISCNLMGKVFDLLGHRKSP